MVTALRREGKWGDGSAKAWTMKGESRAQGEREGSGGEDRRSSPLWILQWGYGGIQGDTVGDTVGVQGVAKYVWHEGMRCNNRQQRER